MSTVVDLNQDGTVGSVLVCSWPTAGLTLWRTGLQVGLPEEVAIFSVRLAGTEPIELATFRWYREREGMIRAQDATMADRFVPQLRWALGRLGLRPYDDSPVLDTESERNPWVGAFVDRTSSLLVAIGLDSRCAALRAKLKAFAADSYARGSRSSATHSEAMEATAVAIHPFYMLAASEDPTLGACITSFLDGLVDARHGSVRRKKDTGGDPDPWSREGTYLLSVYRTLPNAEQHGGSVDNKGMYVANWSGPYLVSFMEWLSAWGGDDHPSWGVVDASVRSEFLAHQTNEGSLSIDEDEVALYDALGEGLPYLWPTEKFVTWAADRWVNR